MMSDEVNFEFGFNSRAFSDRILKIEVADEAPSRDLDSKGDQLPDLKRKRCEETMNDNNELGSSSSKDLDSEGDKITDLKSKKCEEATQDDNEIGSSSAAVAATDSEIILRVESVHVSSIILAAKSKFFLKLFSNGMQESEQQHVTVRVRPSEETAFMELIRFMYSGKLSSISPPFLLGVLTIADKFDVPTCMNYCIQQAMALPMTNESALLYLDPPPALSMVSAAEPLVNAAKVFLGNKYTKIMAVSKDELSALPLSAIEAIFGRDDLEITQEDMVYDILVEWARARYPKPEERRFVFNHRLAPLVRFAHVSYGRLTDLLVRTDLNVDLDSKPIAEALIFKGKSPLRQRELQDADWWLAERAYTRIPFKMVEFESQFPHCIIYLDFKKDKLAKLFPLGEICTQEIRLGGESFLLLGCCDLDTLGPNGVQCFGFYLESMLENEAENLTVAYDFAAWSQSLYMFVSKGKGVHNLKRGDNIGYISLFEVPWTKFMAEDSPYFVDGILRMRVQLDAIATKVIS